MRDGRRPVPSAGGVLSLRLARREPFAAAHLLDYVAARAVTGVEVVDGDTYRRSLRLEHGMGVVALTMSGDAVQCRLQLDDLADTQAAVQRCRRMFDLDADPTQVDAHLATDPLLAPLVRARPGLRSPGHPDGVELLVRAVLGQQVSVRGARTLAARLVAAHGEPLATAEAGVTHVFPSAATIAQCSPADFAMPRARGAALIDLCGRLAAGEIVIDSGSDRSDVAQQLQDVRGIGPWTAGYVAMRALNDPDVFLPTDVGVRNALVALGRDGRPSTAGTLADAWRPWRSYALHHLWASLASAADHARSTDPDPHLARRH
jgi:AraC family transcriptional regulator of adaptative response / DNA-3-methyladenine glycosylase II